MRPYIVSAFQNDTPLLACLQHVVQLSPLRTQQPDITPTIQAIKSSLSLHRTLPHERSGDKCLWIDESFEILPLHPPQWNPWYTALVHGSMIYIHQVSSNLAFVWNEDIPTVHDTFNEITLMHIQHKETQFAYKFRKYTYASSHLEFWSRSIYSHLLFDRS